MNSHFVAKALGQKSTQPAPYEFASVTTDSRKIAPGCLFVPLKGDKFDGHDFIDEALKKGARGIISARPISITAPEVYYYPVTDTLEAYRQIAAAWRDQFQIPICVVAGSVGKTTSKELLYAILTGRPGPILKTEASQNGFIGVAMTLLELRSTHRAAVVEVGIDDIGAMQTHLDILKPNFGIITAIGPEHLEKLIDIPTVAREESLALTKVNRLGGKLALNLDDPWIAKLQSTLDPQQTLAYSLEQSGNGILHGKLNDQSLTLSGAGLDGTRLSLPLLGRHNALNLLGAVAMARQIGLDAAEITQGLAGFKGAVGRSEIKELPGPTPVICDYYNSNPTSLAAGIEILQQVASRDRATPRRTWACLGDMLELGPEEERFHREVADRLLMSGVFEVLLYGPRMRWLADELSKRGFKGNCTHFDTHARLSHSLIQGAKSGDAILIKGSRGMKMEEIWKELEPHASAHWRNSTAH